MRMSGRFGSFAEPLEERVLMAMSLKAGGSGFSNLLATDSAAVRQQKLIIDPPEPRAGSTSSLYDPKLVTVRGATPGPGYENDFFAAFVGVQVGQLTQLQRIEEFLREPAGPETGYLQVRYQLTGQAGKMIPPREWLVLDVGGTEGMDTHALDFALLDDVRPDQPIEYRVFAARKGEFGNPDEDFLITNDGSDTRLGPDQLSPAQASTLPVDGSVSGTVFEDSNRNGVFDGDEKLLPDVLVYLDLNRDGKFTDTEPNKRTNELGGYFFDDLEPGEYAARQLTPPGYLEPPTGTENGNRIFKVMPGQRERNQNFGNVPNPPPIATPILTDVTGPGTHHWFKVAYTDDTAVRYQTIGSGDVVVTGPGGYSQTGVLANLTFSAGTWTATYRVPAPGGSWDAPDNGTYTVSMRPGEVSDTAGAFVPAGPLGTFAVRRTDDTPPTATLGDAPPVATGGGTHYWFKVVYNDDVAVRYQTIGAGDVQVTGPNGYSQLGTLSNLSFSGGTWTVTYRVPAPGGTFDAADNGTYVISMRGGEVSDTAGNFVPAGTLGSFAIRVGDSVAPVATLLPSTVTRGWTHHWFRVTYADNAGVAFGTIGNGDVLVTGPGGYSQPGVLANLTFANSEWTATYRVPAPGGTWDAADNGTYTVSMQPGQVTDTSGNPVPAGPIGTITVSLPSPQVAAATESAPATLSQTSGVSASKRKAPSLRSDVLA